MPWMLDTPADNMPKSGMVVLPRITQPASRSLAAGGASAGCGAASSFARVPMGAGSPFV